MAAHHLDTATFAGGCFWCMEPPFDALEGVESTEAGYTGGTTENPSYEEVCSGTTGHAEAVRIVFNPEKVSYSELLDVFWRNIDPTTKNRQFADRGSQYRTAIFYHSDTQKETAEASRKSLEQSGNFSDPIVTEITSAGPWYRAEEHHQNYYRKRAAHYQMYKVGSGRAGYIKRMWGEEK